MGLRHLALLLDLSHEGTVYVLSPQQILLLLFALPVTWTNFGSVGNENITYELCADKLAREVNQDQRKTAML